MSSDVSILLCFAHSANAEVQKNALALINAMFQRSDPEQRKVKFEFSVFVMILAIANPRLIVMCRRQCILQNGFHCQGNVACPGH